MNLDGATDSELANVAKGGGKLASYAATALQARAARLAGKILVAQGLEARMESLYQALPAKLRW